MVVDIERPPSFSKSLDLPLLYNCCLFLFLRHGIQKTKEHILHKWDFTEFYSKNNFCVWSNWVDFIHYTEIIILSKNMIFLYISKIFFTMLHLKMSLEYWIILHIFGISLCVTSPWHIYFPSFNLPCLLKKTVLPLIMNKMYLIL